MNLHLPDFNKANVLVIGDIMLDCYWMSTTGRISPEAPVPVAHVRKVEEKPGGASNVALNVSALGSDATLIGRIGKDDAGKTLQDLLEAEKITCHFHKTNTVPTISKIRVISQHQQLIRLDFEQPEAEFDCDKIIKIYNKCLANVDAVIISDYGKGINICIPALIQAAAKLRIPVLVDPKNTNFSIYRGASIITPNFTEFEAVVGKCVDEKDIVSKALQLIQEYELEALLVTRGSQGMSLVRKNEEPLHISTHAQEVFDVTGAGDTVIATLGAALAAGENLADATRLANMAAGIVVQKLGAATASPAELRRELRRQQDSWLGVINETHLLEEIADAKAHGETIVMTNGCFDILHAGHVAYLEQAKALGDRLIIAVNDDASIKRLKGDDRPVNHLEQRMAVLAGLRCVDWVVSFSEDTPERLIKKITPDILVKGGDWKIEDIVGSDYVQKHGGKVMSLPYVDDQSTTNIINRIRGE